MWSDVSRSRDVLGSSVHWWGVVLGPGRKAGSLVSCPSSRTGHPHPRPVCLFLALTPHPHAPPGAVLCPGHSRGPS